MNLPIIDSHIHFWDPNHLTYEWIQGDATLNQTYRPERLLEQSAELTLEGIVFVQAAPIDSQGLDEVKWVTELADDEHRIQGIVAYAPLELGEGARADVEALQDYPLVKGIRRLIQGESIGFAVQDDFVRGVQMLTDYEYSFDICITHPQLENAIELVQRCPDVSFVLDHLGKPGVKDGLFEPWGAQIETLAERPNVMCKLSGLATEADHANWDAEQLKPYIDHIIDSFGIDRVMYGGDWPVSLLATEYPQWIETLDWATSYLSEEEKQKLFFSNAQTFYRLPA